MKKIILAGVTALTAVGALATPASAQSWNNHNDRGDHRRDDNRGGQWNQGRFDNRGQNFRQWRRGDRVSAYDMRRYREVDYRRYHLRAPPRGYRYVRDDRGETLLVGIATGAILSILLSH